MKHLIIHLYNYRHGLFKSNNQIMYRGLLLQQIQFLNIKSKKVSKERTDMLYSVYLYPLP